MTALEDQTTRQTEPPQSREETLPRLLVIEDDLSTCIAISKLANKVGFATTIAVSVGESLELLRTQRYECITLDLMLGKSSSVPLIRAITDRASRTPIVIVSGSPDWLRTVAASLGKAAKLNILEILTKPIDFARLRTILLALKGKSRALV